MNLNTILLPVLTALICSALISFTCTPTASFIAYKIGAIDVPTDGRRMHKKPIPRLGGLAVFVCNNVRRTGNTDGTVNFSGKRLCRVDGGFR